MGPLVMLAIVAASALVVAVGLAMLFAPQAYDPWAGDGRPS